MIENRLSLMSKAQHGLLEAARFMDSNECKTMISVARSSQGKDLRTILNEFNKTAAEFLVVASKKFGNKGEW
jgi:4-hydroxy-4-methyl-2-oxoglutarate aldolase